MADETDKPVEERESDGDSTATKAPPKRRKKSKPAPAKPDGKTDKLPPYKVLLHNDDHNDMEHVVLTILGITPLKEFEAIRCMYEAHNKGLSLLLTTHKERAELYRDQFKSKSLKVTIEPA